MHFLQLTVNTILFHSNFTFTVILIVLLVKLCIFQLSTGKPANSPLICPDDLQAKTQKVKLCVDSREKLRLGSTPKKAVLVKPTFSWSCLKKGCRCYSIRFKKSLLKKAHSNQCLQISLPPLYQPCPSICPTCQCLMEEVNYRLQF